MSQAEPAGPRAVSPAVPVDASRRPPQDRELQERRRQQADLRAAEPQPAGTLRRFYREAVRRLVRFWVPPGARVLELGCGAGSLLAALDPSVGVGVDHSVKMIERARARYPELDFRVADSAEFEPEPGERFDYIVLSNLVGELVDVQRTLQRVRALCHPETRVIITYFNYFWQPLVTLAERLRLKPRQHAQNWLTPEQLGNLCELADLEAVTWGRHLLLPAPLPLLERVANRLLGPLPGLNRLCLNEYLVARPGAVAHGRTERTVSVIVACKDEAGNVAETIRSVPAMGLGTELIFVDGHSTDGTVEEIERCQDLNPALQRVRVLVQDERGKAEAVRKGFAAAENELLMILDADNTVRGEDLPKFYEALASGQAEFVNGTRLVFPMEDQAMRYLNYLANHAFGVIFSWLMGQKVTDTLCGTKVLLKRHWENIDARRLEFGVDPFGDFDLLFGAARAGLRIREVPIRYRARDYGDIKIQRFRNGVQLLRMAVKGFRRFKQV